MLGHMTAPPFRDCGIHPTDPLAGPRRELKIAGHLTDELMDGPEIVQVAVKFGIPMALQAFKSLPDHVCEADLAEAVCTAARKGLLRCLETLLACGANPCSRDSDGDEALFLAARNNKTDAVRMLLRAGARVSVGSVLAAIRRGHEATAALLLKHHWRRAGRLPSLLHEAVDMPGVIKALLAAGADVSAPDRSGKTLLAKVAARGDVSTVRELLSRGARACAATLPSAVKSGNADVVVLVLSSQDVGLQAINAPDPDGRSLLHLAAAAGRADMVGALLMAGAQPLTMDYQEESPVQAAARGGHIETVRRIVAATGDAEHALPTGATLLHMAACRGQHEMCKELLRAGAPPNAVDFDGATPLDYAARAGAYRAAKVLLQANAIGADNLLVKALKNRDWSLVRLLQQANSLGLYAHARCPVSGRNALHQAAAAGLCDVVVGLLFSGADLHAVDYAGANALQLAVSGEHDQVIVPLMDAGAVLLEEDWEPELDSY